MKDGKGIPEAVAFAALVAGTAALELHDKNADGLWIIVVLWALLSSWGQR